MSSALQTRLPMTQEEFFLWDGHGTGRYEFDGTGPVAMNGVTVDHSQITLNIHFALRTRLAGTACRPLGPDVGVETVENAVRYPDALVTCMPAPGAAYKVPGVVAVFEVVSSTSGRMDRIVKVREYRAVANIRRYVIVERTSVGLTVLSRDDGAADWTATTLTTGDTLDMPEIGVAIPVEEFYEGVDFG